MHKWPLVFFVSLTVAALLQGVRVFELPMPDAHIWSEEARYIVENDYRQYDFLGGYGHPGGPMLEGTIAVHGLGYTYPQAVKIVVYVLGCIFTAAIALACYVLRPNTSWWLIETVLVSVSWLYIYATPTTILAALLSLLLFLLTWLIYEKTNHKKTSTILLIPWILAAGGLVAVRADIGSVLAVSFSLYLLLSQRITLRQVLIAGASAFSFFFILDPFMWRSPIAHLEDLAAKIIFQVYYYPMKDVNSPDHIIALMVLSVTAIVIVGIVALWHGKYSRALPNSLYFTLLAITAALCPIFMSVHYGSERYFVPLAFIWESVIPITLLTVAPNHRVIKILSWTPAVTSLACTMFFVWLQFAFSLPR